MRPALHCIRRFRFLPFAGVLASLAAHAQDLTLSCAFDPPTIETLANATRVTVPDCTALQRVGAPLIPFRTVRVLLPPGAKVSGLQAIAVGETERAVIAQPVEHGRLPVHYPTANAPSATSDFNGPDPAVYRSDQPYPPARAELASVQRLEGYEIALVRVYPVQYWPNQAELAWTRQLNLEITLDTDSRRSAVLPRSSSLQPRPAARQRIAKWVDNPGILKTYDTTPQPSKSSLNDFDYLLITRSNLVTAFQPLVDLKTQVGLSVKVETVESITNTFAGRDNAEKIRNYIKYAYETWGVSYVLLGGDISVVPCRYAYVYMGSLVSNPTLPADLYYACLDGSWNRDGDSNWGEPDDGETGGEVDLLAEVFVGRAPVETPAEASLFVEKTVRYATQRHAHVDHALLLAELLDVTPGGPAQGGDMFDPLVPLLGAYQTTWLDDRFTVPEWRKQDALSAMNQSPHLVLLNGHGNDNTLIGLLKPFVRSIETPDIDALTNSWPFLAYSVGCNVGQFDNDLFSPDCIGEELVKQHSRGAFAAILNSRLGWYDDQDEAKYSGEFQTRFFTQLLSSGKTNLGAANQLGKHDLASRVESSGVMTYRWCYYEITLFGDPHLAWQTPLPPVAVTSRGTPVPWLVSYGWTNDFEAVDAGDADGDGMATWQEYVAGTNPVEALSALRLSVEATQPAGVRLSWPSAANRLYAVWTSTGLRSSAGFTLLTNNLVATPPVNTFVDLSQEAAPRFYQIEVKHAP